MEGPSLYILAQELQKFKKQRIKKIYGNAKFEKEPLINQVIQDIYSFGKKLIIQLDEYVLTIHFLMYGSYRIDSPREGFTERLALITPKYSFFVYNCSAKCIKEKNLKAHLPFDHDILSNTWNIVEVVKSMKNYPNQTIDDVLLDQEVFAGVGNIIKNEALFLSKTSPLKKVSQLSTKKLKEIALNARLFSMKFLELRKKFELKKNLQIYRKSYCPICKGKVIKTITGKRKRWSFFCPKCQK